MDTVSDIAIIIAMARDIVFFLLLAALLLVLIVLFRKVSALLDSVKRTIKDAEEVISAVSDKVVGPATKGSGVAFGVGKAGAFLLGLRKRGKGGKKNGE
ncbi:MAG: hypothetical protein IIC84_01720 [Chloroflexi bacterium]|nr:hypothetical protein [Chloroflexota bacterium]